MSLYEPEDDDERRHFQRRSEIAQALKDFGRLLKDDVTVEDIIGDDERP